MHGGGGLGLLVASFLLQGAPGAKLAPGRAVISVADFGAVAGSKADSCIRTDSCPRVSKMWSVLDTGSAVTTVMRESHRAMLRDTAEKGSTIELYDGKRVVVGHTPVTQLPELLSEFTPDDPSDVYLHKGVAAIDTGCGTGGFLSAIELPSGQVYESR